MGVSFGNKPSAISEPRTQMGRPPDTSRAVRNRPSSTLTLLVIVNSSSVPTMMAFSMILRPYLTFLAVPMIGDTLCTSSALRSRARACSIRMSLRLRIFHQSCPPPHGHFWMYSTSAPIAEMLLLNARSNPSMAVPMRVTDRMPMKMPSAVRIERILLARMAPKAISNPSFRSTRRMPIRAQAPTVAARWVTRRFVTGSSRSMWPSRRRTAR